ncbi:MAG TPA: chemotaxis-specific protein-glutamate methyltransferase CheB [Opitutaceae bacterium]|jgi:two-component system chemotaxis response regulator CheB|nr:chemotaxis-specific protein-glutamate methyltransferase CheB [Opitutaceae bacterium]
MQTAEPKIASTLRVLVVDDSAFVRKVVKEMLSGDTGIEVLATARDGEEALALTESLRPDVVVCDLMMPKLNGVEYIRRQMKLRPLPILVLSAAAQNAAEVIDALSAGAIDVVTKPNALATDDLRVVRNELVEKLLGTSSAVPRILESAVIPQPVLRPKPGPTKVDIVVIGISTGGPQALRKMIPMLAADFPVPVAVVLHMPVGYTSMYAEKLNELSQLEVKEVNEGDLMRPGMVYVAQAGRHFGFRKMPDGTVVAHLTMQPLEKIHRPAADVLFKSASEVYGDRVLAVVMTGMGDDGKEGSAWVKAQGGTVFTEDEKSCIIYGMPRSVNEAGLSDGTFTLDDMAQAITSRI